MNIYGYDIFWNIVFMIELKKMFDDFLIYFFISLMNQYFMYFMNVYVSFIQISFYGLWDFGECKFIDFMVVYFDVLYIGVSFFGIFFIQEEVIGFIFGLGFGFNIYDIFFFIFCYGFYDIGVCVICKDYGIVVVNINDFGECFGSNNQVMFGYFCVDIGICLNDILNLVWVIK